MQNLFLYMLQVNVLLSLLFIGYHFLLRKLTFYKLNRIYFLAGAGYALVYPFIHFKSFFAESSIPVVSEAIAVLYEPVKTSAGSPISLMDILLVGAAVGVLFFTIVLTVRIWAISGIHRDSVRAVWKKYTYREVPYKLNPFAFFKAIYLHQKQHSPVQLETIFKHENIHVKGLHTLDIVVYEILWAMNWFNPLMWWMRKSVRQNLEYLTDRQLLDQGVDRRDYQYTLTGLAQHKAPYLPGNTFSFKPLKNRIMMMNKKPSSRFHLGKYLFLLPVLVFIGVGFTAAVAQEKIEDLTQKTQEIVWKVDELIYNTEGEGIQDENYPLVVIDGKIRSYKRLRAIKPEQIKQIDVLKGEQAEKKYGEEGKHGVIEVTLKDGEEIPPISSGQIEQALDNYKEALFIIDGKESNYKKVQKLNPEQIQYVGIIKDPEHTAEYGEKGRNGVIKIALKSETGKIWSGNRQDPPPLYLINGEKKSAEEVQKLDPEQIESINILKDKKATDEYGEKGKNGVVIIRLKNSEE